MSRPHAGAAGIAAITLTRVSVSVADVRLQVRPMELDPATARAERAAIELHSGATVVDGCASAAGGGSIAEILCIVPGLELDADFRAR